MVDTWQTRGGMEVMVKHGTATGLPLTCGQTMMDMKTSNCFRYGSSGAIHFCYCHDKLSPKVHLESSASSLFMVITFLKLDSLWGLANVDIFINKQILEKVWKRKGSSILKVQLSFNI